MRPKPLNGMRHVALFVTAFEACKQFYVEQLGMKVEWEPDEDNVYLTSGNDNLALHRAPKDFDISGAQRLDHIGFILREAREVDEWHQYLVSLGVEIKAEPRTHRDGARSFYCIDPDGVVVQMIHHPPIAN